MWPRPNQWTNWVPGMARPYESLYSLLHRFARLNPIRESTFRKTYFSRYQTTGNCHLDYASAEGVHHFVDVARLAHAMGERPAQFRYAYAGAFPSWTRRLFGRHLQWCPACAQRAYHTILFSLIGLEHCPIHKVPLLQTPCGCLSPQPRLNELALNWIHSPPACGQCRRPYFPVRAVREMGLQGADFAPLTRIVSWIENAASTCWVNNSDLSQENLSARAFADLVHTWHTHHGNKLPPSPWREGLGVPRREQSDPVRLTYSARGKLVYEREAYRYLRRTWHDYRGDLAIFKSIRRQIICRLLGGRREWLMKLRTRSDFDFIDIAGRHWPEARFSWAVLTWCRFVLRARCTADLYGRPYGGRSGALPLHPAYDIHMLAPPGCGWHENDWVWQHLLAAWLLRVWDLALHAALEDSPRLIDWKFPESLPDLSWGATLERQGSIALSIAAPHGRMPRKGNHGKTKWQRVAEAKMVFQKRQTEVGALCATMCIRFADAKMWQRVAGAVPPPEAAHEGWLRWLPLFKMKKPVRFVLFQVQRFDYVARSFSPNIEARGQYPREAINGLRDAINWYWNVMSPAERPTIRRSRWLPRQATARRNSPDPPVASAKKH